MPTHAELIQPTTWQALTTTEQVEYEFTQLTDTEQTEWFFDNTWRLKTDIERAIVNSVRLYPGQMSQVMLRYRLRQMYLRFVEPGEISGWMDARRLKFGQMQQSVRAIVMGEHVDDSVSA